MAISYIWDIQSLGTKDVEDNQQVIHYVKAEYRGTDSETGVSAIIVKDFSLDVSDLSTFTPYDSVTKDTVIAWIESLLDSEYLEQLQKIIDSKINVANIDQSISVGNLPWDVAETTEEEDGE